MTWTLLQAWITLKWNRLDTLILKNHQSKVSYKKATTMFKVFFNIVQKVYINFNKVEEAFHFSIGWLNNNLRLSVKYWKLCGSAYILFIISLPWYYRSKIFILVFEISWSDSVAYLIKLLISRVHKTTKRSFKVNNIFPVFYPFIIK